MFCLSITNTNNDRDNLLFLTFLFCLLDVTLQNNDIIVVLCDFVFVIICILPCYVLFLK